MPAMETELKFTPGRAICDRLAALRFEESPPNATTSLHELFALPAAYGLKFVMLRPIADTYVDTDDLALDAQGACIRIRRQPGRGDLLTIKRRIRRSDGLFEREEIESPIEYEAIQSLQNNGYREVVQEHFQALAGKPLHECVRIENQRIQLELFKDGGACEWCLDRFYGVGLTTDDADRRTPMFLEIEIESRNDAGQPLLLELREHLKQTQDDLTWSVDSKYERIVSALKLRKA